MSRTAWLGLSKSPCRQPHGRSVGPGPVLSRARPRLPCHLEGAAPAAGRRGAACSLPSFLVFPVWGPSRHLSPGSPADSPDGPRALPSTWRLKASPQPRRGCRVLGTRRAPLHGEPQSDASWPQVPGSWPAKAGNAPTSSFLQTLRGGRPSERPFYIRVIAGRQPLLWGAEG